MTTTVSAVEARHKFGHLLNLVSLTHEQVIIERAGKKIAILSEYSNNPSHKTPIGKLNICDIEGLGKEIWQDIDTDEYIRKERESWE